MATWETCQKFPQSVTNLDLIYLVWFTDITIILKSACYQTLEFVSNTAFM